MMRTFGLICITVLGILISVYAQKLEFVPVRHAKFEEAHRMLKELVAAGDYSNALFQVDYLLHTQEWPVDRRAGWYRIRGDIHMKTGKMELAEKDFSRVIRYDHGRVDGYINRGHARSRMRRFGAAMKDYEKAAELAPNHPRVLYALASLAHMMGDRDRANQLLDNLLEIDAENADAFTLLGKIQSEMRNYKDAENNYRAALVHDPEHVVARVYLAELLIKQGDYDKASPLLDLSVIRQPDHPDLYAARGLARFLNGDVEHAMQDYETAEMLGISDPAFFVNKAVLYRQLGRYQDSFDALDQAEQLDPDYFEARLNRGLLYLKRGQYTDAERIFSAFAADFSTDPFGPFYLGFTLEKTGREREALQQYREALQRDPDHAMAHNNLAAIYIRRRKGSEALPHLDHALEVQPELLEARVSRGKMMSMRGDFSRALEDFNRAVELDPGNAEWHLWRARIFYGQSKYALALDDCNHALKLDTNYGEGYAVRAKINEALGQIEQAAEDRQKARSFGAY